MRSRSCWNAIAAGSDALPRFAGGSSPLSRALRIQDAIVARLTFHSLAISVAGNGVCLAHTLKWAATTVRNSMRRRPSCPGVGSRANSSRSRSLPAPGPPLSASPIACSRLLTGMVRSESAVITDPVSSSPVSTFRP
jgi:hypothetical protein